MTRHTPLFDEHQCLHAKMTEFHGWALPLQYRTIVEEHLHCRHAASIFDCSHMGVFFLTADAAEVLDPHVFINPLAIMAGRCRYASLLTACGGIIDDAILCRIDQDTLMVVTNAGPLDRVSALLKDLHPDVWDASPDIAKIDVQGPASREVLVRLGFESAKTLRYFTCCRDVWQDRGVIVTRAGYTGELGYEIYLPNETAPVLWNQLIEQPEVAPAGLGARDTLRLEMGFTLYGQDVDENTTSLEAGMARFIDWDCDFRAKQSLWIQRELGRYRIRTGIRSFDRRAPRTGFEVRSEGQPVGIVTSGTFGPSVGVGIGMAYVPLEFATPGVRLTAGPKDLELEVVEMPFYRDGSLRA